MTKQGKYDIIGVGVGALASAVILQAYSDATQTDDVYTHNKALIFFHNACKGEPEEVWFDLVGLDPHIAFQRIASVNGYEAGLSMPDVLLSC